MVSDKLRNSDLKQNDKIEIIPAEIVALAENVGSFIQYWGFKKIHGQIWTHIWLSKSPIAATTLVQRLGVSKALVSLALKDLIEFDVIKILGLGDRRKILLAANQDVQSVIAKVLKKREATMLDAAMKSNIKVQQLSQIEKDKINLDDAKLEQMKILIEIAQMSLSAVISNQLDSDS